MVALTVATMGVVTTISQFWVLPARDPQRHRGGCRSCAGKFGRQYLRCREPVADRHHSDANGFDGQWRAGLAVSLVIGAALVFTVSAALVNSRRRNTD